jgi:hypothetical protein
MTNNVIKVSQVSPNDLTSTFFRGIRDGIEGSSQSAHDLERTDTVLTDLVESERQIILPCRHGKDETEDAVRVPGIP